jgi:ATP-dependent protease ClpP protease subunit
MVLIKTNFRRVKKTSNKNKEKYIEDDNSFENLIGFTDDKIEDNNQSPNEYYLYSDITVNSVMGLLKFIKNAEKRWNNFLLENFDIVEKAEPKPLKIYINSEGGEIFAAIPLIDAITNSKIPIHTYIEGIAASAASLISMSGSKNHIKLY